MIDQRVADVTAAARDHTQPRRGSPHSSSKRSASLIAENGVWLAGLEHHRAARGDRGADLVGDEIQRKVERLIAPTTPTGTRRTNPSLPAPASLASSGTISPVRVRATAARELEGADCSRCFDARRLMGFAASMAMVRAKVLLTLAQQPCGLIEDLRPLMRHQRRRVHHVLCGGHRAVDVGGRAPRYRAHDGAVMGVDDFDRFARLISVAGQGHRLLVCHAISFPTRPCMSRRGELLVDHEEA